MVLLVIYWPLLYARMLWRSVIDHLGFDETRMREFAWKWLMDKGRHLTWDSSISFYTLDTSTETKTFVLWISDRVHVRYFNVSSPEWFHPSNLEPFSECTLLTLGLGHDWPLSQGFLARILSIPYLSLGAGWVPNAKEYIPLPPHWWWEL